MTHELPTSWDLIHAAASGDSKARQDFAERYGAVITAYFGARWQACELQHCADDAAQEAFVDCLREGGALERAKASLGEFRGFLHGVLRNIALRFERERGRARSEGAVIGSGMDLVPSDESSASRVFDREWARGILRLAIGLHRRQAAELGAVHARRVELLRLRFEEGRPIRMIASDWGCEADWLHHEFARARRDFKRALATALGLDQSMARERLEAEVERLWEALQ